MRKSAAAAVVAVVVALAGAASASAQQKAGALSTQDYLEIHELYARYNHAIDLGAGSSAGGVAELFTEDGTLNKTMGRTALLQMGKQGEGPRRHITTSIVLTPTAQGVNGAAYYFLVDASSKDFNLVQGGVYEDTLVRTDKGWRFKTRQTRPAAPAPAAPR